MPLRHIQDLPTANEVMREHPIDPGLVDPHRAELIKIMTGEDDRLACVIGYCSWYPHAEALEYCDELRRQTADTRGEVMLVSRVHTGKPRTTTGYEGLEYMGDPFDPQSYDMRRGLFQTRQVFAEVVGRGHPLSDEILNPDYIQHFKDGLTYGWIGARTVSSPKYKKAPGGMDCPFGVKHPTNGDLNAAVATMIVSQCGLDEDYLHARGVDVDARNRDPYRRHPTHIDIMGAEYEVPGNPHLQLVLRGEEKGRNFHPEKMTEASELMEDAQIVNGRVLVDVSHENARRNGNGKKPEHQLESLGELIEYAKAQPDVYSSMCGVAAEGALIGGSYNPKNGRAGYTPGMSVTDPCMSLEQSVEFVQRLAQLRLDTRSKCAVIG